MVVILPAREKASRVHRRTGKATRPPLDTCHVEQPQAVNERLVLDGEKWRRHPLGDDHSTIRRDLQTAHSRKPCHPAEFSASVVLAGSPSVTPSCSPPTSPHGPASPPGLPAGTSCWSTAAPGAGLDRPHFAEVAAREVVAHDTERPEIKLEEESAWHQLRECEHKGSRVVCRAAAPAVAPAPCSAADGTSCGDRWRYQLAAETLVNMAWTAAGRQGTVQQQSLRTADQQPQRSTMDSPATPNQEPCSQEPPCEPMPLAYGTPVEHVWPVHSQPLLQLLGPALFAAAQHAPPLLHQHGPYIQDAAPPYSNAPQPPSPYSIAAPPPPPPTLYGFLLQSLPAARGPFCSIAPQPPPASAPPYSIVPQPAPHPMSVTLSLQHTPAASECLWNAAPGALQQKFETLVMCNFTPTHPRELPTSRWVSFTTLYRLFRPHNWEDVWLMGPGNLKQLITKWYEGHPAFAGLDVKQWCKRLSNNETQGGRYVYKFCFEHTPNKAATM